VFTLHGGEINDYYFKKGFYQLLKNHFLNKAFREDTIVSPSKWQIKKLKKELRKKITIIPNSVNTDEFRPLGIKKEKNSILFVGRFVEIKGVNELLSVAKNFPEYTFYFVGWGPLGERINLNNTKNLGVKSREELVKLYNKSTICVFPSHRESFGIAALEAMACSKPVITTKKGFSEFIENGKDGIIIDSKNEISLKNSIKKLMEDSNLRETMGKNARKKALMYKHEYTVRKYLRLFQKLVN